VTSAATRTSGGYPRTSSELVLGSCSSDLRHSDKLVERRWSLNPGSQNRFRLYDVMMDP
jgi:hypothetical protein